MKISDLRELLKDKRVVEEINKHLWIESQKAGYSIGIERATDEWLRLYAEGWLRYNRPEEYAKRKRKKSKKPSKKSSKKASKKSSKKSPKKPVKKQAKKKTVIKKKTATKRKKK